MFTGITSLAEASVAAVVLTGGAILCGGAAAADPSQDEQFLALLEKEDIPALQNVPSLIAQAHVICRNLDRGVPADDVVNDMRNNSFTAPGDTEFPERRIMTTITRFITASVEAYCPQDQRKIASIMANPVPGLSEPTHRVAAHTHEVVNSGSGLPEAPPFDMINMPAAWQEPTDTGVVRLPHLIDGGVSVAGRKEDGRWNCDAHGAPLASLIGASPSGETTPDLPQTPSPPPPTAQILTPPRPIAAPPPRKLAPPPPPPQRPPVPPTQEPPAAAPQPGGGAGGGGTGGGGGGGPAEPSPTPSMPPGLVRLAP